MWAVNTSRADSLRVSSKCVLLVELDSRLRNSATEGLIPHEDKYRTARSKLLDRFANETSPGVAERVSRAYLLRPAEGSELKQAAILAERAAAADHAKVGTSFAHYQFVQGLADDRQGRLDRAIATMRGDASKVLGPAPKLVLAMALYQSGEVAEARKGHAAAIAGHDWDPANVRDQDGWEATHGTDSKRASLPSPNNKLSSGGRAVSLDHSKETSRPPSAAAWGYVLWPRWWRAGACRQVKRDRGIAPGPNVEVSAGV
jgi:hypothetical protein